MDILLSKYGVIFNEFESIDLGSASVKFSINRKKSIIV